MKSIPCAVLLASLLGGCASFTTPNEYTFDTTALKGKGLTKDCPIVIERELVKVKNEQKYWQIFQHCITKYEPLVKTTKFSWTTYPSLPNGSQLVGYIFFKERLDITTSEKLTTWSSTALRHGGNYGVTMSPKALEDLTLLHKY